MCMLSACRRDTHSGAKVPYNRQPKRVCQQPPRSGLQPSPPEGGVPALFATAGLSQWRRHMQNGPSNEACTHDDALQRGLDLDKQGRQAVDSFQGVGWVGWNRSADLRINSDCR